ncbi:hypothetical protein TSH64_14595 [Azospirillum sp. TSH64]|nr:hypothetical protein TSH64_14595 [Azospirillum sp. TSH64]
MQCVYDLSMEASYAPAIGRSPGTGAIDVKLRRKAAVLASFLLRLPVVHGSFIRVIGRSAFRKGPEAFTFPHIIKQTALEIVRIEIPDNENSFFPIIWQ